MKGWMLHCCLLNEDRWGPFGCDIPKYRTEGGLPRLEIGTPWFYTSLAFAPSGRFGKLKGYRSGMTRDEIKMLPVKTSWYIWNWKRNV